jgi:putative transposase
MQGFRSPAGSQRFVSVQSATRNHFSFPARRRSALTIHYHRFEAFKAWKLAASVA